jgi:GDP/UDP-N,N'-diacetylbacillosamine 2-epimerase (hydrolysing)
MKNSLMLLGNSSSGVYEAASFDKNVINIGDRQKGRLKGENVFDVPFNKDSIMKKYLQLKKMKHKKRNNIFSKKNTARNILKVILNEAHDAK